MTLQLSNIEVARQQNRLFEALKAGSEAVKDLQQQVRLDPRCRDPLASAPRCPRRRCVAPVEQRLYEHRELLPAGGGGGC